MSDIPLHAGIVHLPLGLSLVTPLLAGMGLVGWWRGWLPRQSWSLIVASQSVLVASAFIAMQTGETEEEIVEAVVSHDLIHEHEELAETFSYTSLVALLLMGGALAVRREDYARYVGLGGTVLGIAAAGMGMAAGHEGGELVYEHGAANAYLNKSGAPHAEHAETEDH